MTHRRAMTTTTDSRDDAANGANRVLPLNKMTQVVFARLDPILKALLQEITKLKEVLDDDNVVEEAVWFRLIDIVVKHLQALQKCLQDFAGAPSLILLKDYVTLPLTAIFHLQLPQRIGKHNNNNIPIQQSHVRKILQNAAICIQKYVKACAGGLADVILRKYLVALSVALPSSAEMEASSAGNDCGGDARPQFLLQQSDSLDDGSDLWVAMLETIGCVLTNTSDSDSPLLLSVNPTLQMRLVDSNTGFLMYNATTPQVHLAALQVLQVLMNSSKDSGNSKSYSSTDNSTPAPKQFWQSVFPGVFTPLYKQIMSAGTMKKSGKISIELETKSIECICTLLRIALAEESNATTNNVLQQLSSLALTSNKKSETTTDDKPPAFVQQVQQRVATPLSNILRQKAISRSNEIRKEVLALCGVILVDTRSVWNAKSVDATAIADEVAIEICMALRQDSVGEIAKQATAFLDEYISQPSTRLDTSWMVSKIIEIAEKLPVLMMGTGKQSEVKLELQKLTGYIECCNGKELASAFMDSESFRRALIQLTDVDLESASRNKKQAIVLNDPNASALRLKWLDSDSSLLAKQMLRKLGRTQRPRDAAQMIDGVLSDFLEASQAMPSPSPSRSEWLHQHIGGLVLVQEFIAGAFSSCSENDEKAERKKTRVLQQLSGSVMPLIIDSQLWNLPTGTLQDDCSPQVLEENTAVAILLLELLQTLFSLSSTDSLRSRFPTMLYSIVEKMNRNESRAVADAANQVLSALAISLDMETAEALIFSEQPSLIGAMWGRLRLHAGSSITDHSDIRDALTAASSLQLILKEISSFASKNDKDNALQMKERRAGLVDMMSLVEESMDHLLQQNLFRDEDYQTFCALHKSFFDYFLAAFGAGDAAYSFKSAHVAESKGQPWLNTLYQFQKADKSEGLLRDNAVERVAYQDPERVLDVSQQEVKLFTRLIAGNCYLLSHANLKIRVSSCQGLVSGFKFLAFVGSIHQDSNDEQSVLKNSILRQVSDSWPAIKARLMTLSKELEDAQKRPSSLSLVLGSALSTAAASTDGNQIPFKRMFLSNLLDLVAYLCECSGDFMADRFRNFVFPVVATQLKCLLQRNQSDSHDWSDTERQLMLSMLRCVTRVFRQQECGPSLQSILGNAGNMILPFLEINGDVIVEEAAMDCLKSILQLDCDILWRPLTELSGRTIPLCPLSPTSCKSPHLAVTSGSYFDTPMRVRCQELIDFVEALPEQNIF